MVTPKFRDPTETWALKTLRRKTIARLRRIRYQCHRPSCQFSSALGAGKEATMWRKTVWLIATPDAASSSRRSPPERRRRTPKGISSGRGGCLRPIFSRLMPAAVVSSRRRALDRLVNRGYIEGKTRHRSAVEDTSDWRNLQRS